MNCTCDIVPPEIVDFEVPGTMQSENNETLRCVATGYPLPQIEWLYNDTVLPTDLFVTMNRTENSTVQEVESIVHLFSVTEEHAGNYTCIVKISNYSIYTISQSGSVSILAPPTTQSELLAPATDQDHQANNQSVLSTFTSLTTTTSKQKNARSRLVWTIGEILMQVKQAATLNDHYFRSLCDHCWSCNCLNSDHLSSKNFSSFKRKMEK